MNQSRYNFARPLRTNGQPISPINNFSRVYSFPLNVNNLQSDLSQNMNNIFRDLLNTTTNSFFSSVPVVPTQEQINTACEIINYSNDVNYNQSNCPISLTRFTPGQEIMRIRYCGHIFIPSHLRQWFSLNTRCPVCRYDIRTYVEGATISNANNANVDANNANDANNNANDANNANNANNANDANDNNDTNDSSNNALDVSNTISYSSADYIPPVNSVSPIVSSPVTVTSVSTIEDLEQEHEQNPSISDTSNINNNLDNILVHTIQDLLNDTSMNQSLLNFQYSVFDPNNIR